VKPHKPPRHLADLDMAQRRAALEEAGEPGYRAEQLSRNYFVHHGDLAAMTDVPARDRDRLVAAFMPRLLDVVRTVECDEGKTRKTLWRLGDGSLVESVLMRYPDRATMGVSSPAGCGMGCPVRAPGQAGLTRNLSAAEIVEQIIVGGRGEVDNIVFMGMGGRSPTTPR
jgi:23S rRNA (adenine2503-C2)-methyltransferase